MTLKTQKVNMLRNCLVRARLGASRQIWSQIPEVRSGQEDLMSDIAISTIMSSPNGDGM
jgi:hypothetical protein